MLKLAEAVDHPGYGVLLHLGRWDGNEGEEGDRLMAPYAMHTHVDQSVAATRIDATIRLLRDSGYNGCLGVECSTTGAEVEHADVGLQIALVRRACAAAG